MLDVIHLGAIARENAICHGNKVAFCKKEKGIWRSVKWKKVYEDVINLSMALIYNGIKPGDTVGIYSQNMYEIIIADLAIHSIRAVAVPMYATQTAEQVKYITNEANVKIIFAGSQYQYNELAKIGEPYDDFLVVTIDHNVFFNSDIRALRYDDFLIVPSNEKPSLMEEIDHRREHLNYDDIALIIYTSGTTGEPKGVILTNGNACSAIKAHLKQWTINKKGYNSLCFLPLSHIFERGWSYVCMVSQMPIYINSDPKEILQVLKEVKPNCMCAVPRFWEKVYMGVTEKIDKFPHFLQRIIQHSLSVGEKYNIDCLSQNKKPSAILTIQYKLYEKTLFFFLLKVIGLHKGKVFPCAGSVLNEKVNRFIHSIGVNLMVGYGLTETFATVTCYNELNKGYSLKSVGELFYGYECKIDPETNEILLKSPTITPGYYKKYEETVKVFTEDGFFRTGDAGYLIRGQRCDEIVLIERIKDLFKTSNGKYIAPQQIETLLTENKYIEQCCVIADMRKYVTALIVPNYSLLSEYAQSKGIMYESIKELVEKEEIISFFQKMIDISMDQLASYERVKYFKLLDSPFTIEKNELTNTLKVRRIIVYEHYKKEIDAMYQHDLKS